MTRPFSRLKKEEHDETNRDRNRGIRAASGSWTVGDPSALADGRGRTRTISVLDDCLPGDEGWNDTGGCLLEDGDVPAAEFFALLRSPLTIPANGILIGHPSWRNEPSHSVTKEGKTIRVVNNGGRTHTFTEVAQFGGGFIGDLNIGLAQANECAPNAVTFLDPGSRDRITGLDPGLHKFQCCIHPWMRATIRVVESDDDDNE